MGLVILCKDLFISSQIIYLPFTQQEYYWCKEGPLCVDMRYETFISSNIHLRSRTPGGPQVTKGYWVLTGEHEGVWEAELQLGD